MLTLAELHQDEYLEHAARHPVPSSINQIDYVRVALQYPLRSIHRQMIQALTVLSYHNINLLLDIIEHGFIRYGNALENMVRCTKHWFGRANEIDVGKAAYHADHSVVYAGMRMDGNAPWLKYFSTCTLYLFTAIICPGIRVPWGC